MLHKIIALILLLLFLFFQLFGGISEMATLLDAHSQSHYNHAVYLADVSSAFGQAFTVKTSEETYKLTKATFWLKKVGSPTGHLRAYLYNMTGTYGVDAKPTGSPLATSQLVDIASLGTDFYPRNFYFEDEFEVTKDQHYCIVFQVVDGNVNAFNCPVCMNSCYENATHDGNACVYESGWAGKADWDCIFYVYGEYVAPPPEKFWLTISHDDNGYTEPSAGNYEYDEGAYVSVKYFPYAGKVFNYWKRSWLENSTEHSNYSGSNPYGFLMTKDYEVEGYGKTPPPTGGWCNPTGYQDPDGKWWNEEYAYDDDLGTYAYPTDYTKYLILTLDEPTPCDRIRFYAWTSYSPLITVDVYNATTEQWVAVYSGAFNQYVWNEKTFSKIMVSKARVKGNPNLCEFDFYQVVTPPVVGVKLGSNLAVLLSGLDKGKVVILV